MVLFSGLSVALGAAEKRAGRDGAVIKVPPVAVRPVDAVREGAPIWHVWTDKEGRKVDAQFCGLSGDFITIQTRDGRTYHFRTDLLIPAAV